MDSINASIWYANEAAYLRFRDICDDKEKFAPPFHEWLSWCEGWVEEMGRKGQFITKIYADPDEFLQWCQVNACRPNSAARSRFAACKAVEINRRTQN